MWQNDETKYNKQICFQSAMFMFKVMFRMLRNPNEATPKSVLWKKSLKLDVLKWMAILGVEGVKGAAENKTCVAIRDRDLLNSNPGCHGGSKPNLAVAETNLQKHFSSKLSYING